MLGIIHMEMGNDEKAKKYFDAIIHHPAASPKIKADAFNNLGDIISRPGKI